MAPACGIFRFALTRWVCHHVFIGLERAKQQWDTLRYAWNPTTEIQLSGSMAFVPSEESQIWIG